MSVVTINGNEYTIPKVDFEAICTLEENGVYLLNMERKNPKLATMIRGLVAWIEGISNEEASQEIQEHLMNGGDLADIMSAVTQAVQSSGFFKQSGRADSEKVTEYPQNREQRRAEQKNQRKSTHH